MSPTETPTNHLGRNSRKFSIDVHGNGELHEFPLLLNVEKVHQHIRKSGMRRRHNLTIMFCVGTPLTSPVLMRVFVKIISVSLTVRSSSFLSRDWFQNIYSSYIDAGLMKL
jgi:hypothetical protein